MNPFLEVKPKTQTFAAEETTTKNRPISMLRVRIGLSLTLSGFLIFLIGARPDYFGLDRSPIIGFVQIAVFLVGLAVICLGGYLSMMAPWRNQAPSIAMDFGVRLVATGYVISVFSGMADVFGFGSHVFPDVPFFGPWQALGVLIGQIVIASGFLLLIPFPVRKANSRENGKG
jgi:hypothetical protein